MKNLWYIFNDWNYIDKNGLIKDNWIIFDQWIQLLKSTFNQKLSVLKKLRDIWNNKLSQFGGNPFNYNWNNFRPLRLSREEDWSDWLIYLLTESKSGYFPYNLLKLYNFKKEDFMFPINYKREVFFEGYRSDIIIQWKHDIFTHIDVKIGDPNLDKTFTTAAKMYDHFSGKEHKWYDFILLLDNQVENWLSISKRKNKKIKYITWKNIDISLRKSIIYSKESIVWKVWAYSFIGAIEEKLFNLKREYKISDLFELDNEIYILMEGLKNE